jgi:TetR/AcrR family transcriptional regulator, cholesterol catabolism regulator
VARMQTKLEAVPERLSQILDGALKIFYDRGYDATSMQDVADAVGILKGSIYHYIDTKEDILYLMLLRIHESFPPLPNLNAPGNVIDKIRDFVEHYVLHVARNIEGATVFHREFRRLTPRRRRVIIARRNKHDDWLRAAIERGVKDGDIAEGTDPKLLSMAIFGMAAGLHGWYHQDGPIKPETIAVTYAELAIRMLVGRYDHCYAQAS